MNEINIDIENNPINSNDNENHSDNQIPIDDDISNIKISDRNNENSEFSLFLQSEQMNNIETVNIVEDLPDSNVTNDSDVCRMEESENSNENRSISIETTSRINWLTQPTLRCKANSVFQKRCDNNYLRGCHWSPDGTCVLTNSNDNILRVFELPRDYQRAHSDEQNDTEIDMMPVLQMPDIDLIYDVCWYPFMRSDRPDTCFFASTSRKNAIILWDAYTGGERARVQPRDHLDEPVSAQSLAFSRDGLKLYSGFDKCVRVFDITRLGDKPERRPPLGKKSDLRGIISCISVSPTSVGMYACGSYSKDAAIFHENSPHEILEFLRADDRVGGITHIEFSPVNPHCVVTGARIDSALHVWDLRNPGAPLYATARRDVRTNQRIYFSFDPSGNYIFSGSHDGHVSVYSINGASSQHGVFIDGECVLPRICEWKAHGDVCNGLSVHPYLPLLATASGQRRIVPPWRRQGMMITSTTIAPDNSEDDSDDWTTDEEIDTMFGVDENQLKIWCYPVINQLSSNTMDST